jgi:hypothetical protein
MKVDVTRACEQAAGPGETIRTACEPSPAAVHRESDPRIRKAAAVMFPESPSWHTFHSTDSRPFFLTL